jgi:hypothetical protein
LPKHRERIEVHLQFDGLRPETCLVLRDEDVSREKKAALSRIAVADPSFRVF